MIAGLDATTRCGSRHDRRSRALERKIPQEHRAAGKLERRWEARLDLLRRGLVRSTLAAEGSDKTVDQCMKEMREVIRSDNMDAGLAGLIPRLEKPCSTPSSAAKPA